MPRQCHSVEATRVSGTIGNRTIHCHQEVENLRKNKRRESLLQGRTGKFAERKSHKQRTSQVLSESLGSSSGTFEPLAGSREHRTF